MITKDIGERLEVDAQFKAFSDLADALNRSSCVSHGRADDLLQITDLYILYIHLYTALSHSHNKPQIKAQTPFLCKAATTQANPHQPPAKPNKIKANQFLITLRLRFLASCSTEIGLE